MPVPACLCVIGRRRRFQAQSFGDVEETHFADDAKDNAVGGGGKGNIIAEDEKCEGRPGRGGTIGEASEEDFKLFSRIAREYIVEGARNEINIRYLLLCPFCLPRIALVTTLFILPVGRSSKIAHRAPRLLRVWFTLVHSCLRREGGTP